MTKPVLRILAVVAFALLATGASAQTYPTRPVTIITPFAAGSVTDATARSIAQHLQEALGQTFIVENRAGAGGMLAASAVAKAAPDGHTLLITTNSTHSAAPGLFKHVPYDPTRDFTPVARIGSSRRWLRSTPTCRSSRCRMSSPMPRPIPASSRLRTATAPATSRSSR